MLVNLLTLAGWLLNLWLVNFPFLCLYFTALLKSIRTSSFFCWAASCMVRIFLGLRLRCTMS